jgi:magnesium-transporting ATPase (P-type)
VDLLETHAEQGLDLFAVRHRLEQFGPNALTQRTGTSALRRFLTQFTDPLVVIMVVLLTYAGFTQYAFGTESIDVGGWGVIVAVGVAAVLLMERRGWIQRRAHVL